MSTQTATKAPGTFDRAAFEAFLAARNEPAWVTEARRAAFENYERLLEAPLDPEEWKRVETRTFRPERYNLVTNRAPAAFSTLMRDRAEFGGHVIHVDGASQERALTPELTKQGVLFGDLTELVRSHPELLEEHLMTRAAQPDADRFAAWHAAFWTGGTVLYVPRGVEVAVPLYSLIGLAEPHAADLSHTLVILEEGASATLLEETASADNQTEGLHVGAVELILGQGAHLRYVQLQNWNEKVWHFARQVGRVGRDAHLQWCVGGLGAKLAHIHQEVNLDAEGAEAEVDGVSFSTGRQTLSYYTQQAHNAAHTRSDLLYKDVLRDRSRVIWRGMIKVEPGAQQTDGYQRNDALILDADARVDAIPGLEIEADDVRCTHGATAGQVDAEQVFYLMSRGLSRYEAMHMIVEGFFQRVFDRIPVELVRETLSQAVQRKLGIGE
jgi:Fe-S cluster assembly protein SufD